MFNKLPKRLKEEFGNPKKFKKSLKNYLSIKTFYSLQENCNIIQLSKHNKAIKIFVYNLSTNPFYTSQVYK